MGFPQSFFLAGLILVQPSLARTPRGHTGRAVSSPGQAEPIQKGEAPSPFSLHVEGPTRNPYKGQTCLLTVTLEGPETLLRSGLNQLFTQEVEIPLDWAVPFLDPSIGGEIAWDLLSGPRADVVLNGEVTSIGMESTARLDGTPLLRLELPIRWTASPAGLREFPPVAVSFSPAAKSAANVLGVGGAPAPARRCTAQIEPVRVLPIPDQDREREWRGALGRYTLSLENAFPSRFVEGEEVALTVLLRGTGNPGKAPVWQGNQRMRVRLLGGENTSAGARWRYGLTALGPGDLETPPLMLSVFDPVLGEFDRSEVSPRWVHVVGGRPIPQSPPAFKRLGESMLIGAFVGALVLGIFLFSRRTNRRNPG